MHIIDKTDDWDARHPESKIEQTSPGKFEMKSIYGKGSSLAAAYLKSMEYQEMKRIEEMMEEMAHVPREELGKRQPGERNAYSETREEYEKRRLSEGKEI